MFLDVANRNRENRSSLVRVPSPSRRAHSEIRGAIFLRGAHSEIRGAHSCPPRGWSGAGLGVDMLTGAEDSLAWKWKRFLGFLVFGFLVSWFYQMSISCSLEDIGPISKIFEISLDESSSFVGARLFEKCQHVGCPTILHLGNIFSKMLQGIFLIVDVSWCLQR